MLQIITHAKLITTHFRATKKLVFLTIILSTVLCYSAQSQIIWSAGSLTFTKTAPGQQDCITAQTCLTRSTVLYNSVCQVVGGNQGCGYTGPCNTEWSYGNITNWNTLIYQPLFTVNGCNPPSMAGNPLVCHLIAENIYLQITFNSWAAGGGNFSYTRTTGPNLPILLSTFSVYNQGRANILNWSSSNEANFSHYNVLRSNDGLSFNNQAKINSKSPDGNSNVNLNYSFTDPNPLNGYNYYRLEQVDKDDHKQYSKIVAIYSEKKISPVEILQKQANRQIQININTDKSDFALIKVLDLNGRILRTGQMTLQPGYNARQMELIGLSNGLYFVQVQTESSPIFTKRILLQ